MDKCTGLRFRAKSQNFFNEKTMSFEHKESLTLLKRSSCSCQECTEIIKDLKNDGGINLIDCVHWRKFSGTENEEIEDGDTYTVKAQWETDDDQYGGSWHYVSEMDFFRVGDRYAR